MIFFRGDVLRKVHSSYLLLAIVLIYLFLVTSVKDRTRLVDLEVDLDKIRTEMIFTAMLS